MKKILFFFVVILSSSFSSADYYVNAYGHWGSGSTPQLACTAYQASHTGTATNRGELSGMQCYECKYSGTCTYSHWGNVQDCGAGNHFNGSSCVPIPPPPNCADKEGEVLTGVTVRFPNDEGEDMDGCYFSCVAKHSFEGPTTYDCTLNGEDAQTDPNTGEELANVDTEDPNYCNNETWNGECIDFNHPDNEGGCGSKGKYFGSFGTEYGEIKGCFGGGSDYEPSGDRDGDGIPNEADDDIDGDGILNEDDVDEDGDGYNEKKDTNNNGIPDSKDPDIDGDGIPNGQDTDADGDGVSDEDQKKKGEGIATVCAKKPTSSGDPQLAAIHQQLWFNACTGYAKKDSDNLKKISDSISELTEEVSDSEAENIRSTAEADGIASTNEAIDTHIADIGTGSESGGPMSGLVESSGLESSFTSLLPQAGACTALQLQFAQKLSLPLPCDKFMTFREWFGWALGLMTAYSIIMIALAPMPKE